MLVFQFDQIFQPYIQYCLEQSTCLQYIKEKKKTNVLFKTYVLVSFFNTPKKSSEINHFFKCFFCLFSGAKTTRTASASD